MLGYVDGACSCEIKHLAHSLSFRLVKAHMQPCPTGLLKTGFMENERKAKHVLFIDPSPSRGNSYTGNRFNLLEVTMVVMFQTRAGELHSALFFSIR